MRYILTNLDPSSIQRDSKLLPVFHSKNDTIEFTKNLITCDFKIQQTLDFIKTDKHYNIHRIVFKNGTKDCEQYFRRIFRKQTIETSAGYRIREVDECDIKTDHNVVDDYNFVRITFRLLLSNGVIIDLINDINNECKNIQYVQKIKHLMLVKFITLENAKSGLPFEHITRIELSAVSLDVMKKEILYKLPPTSITKEFILGFAAKCLEPQCMKLYLSGKRFLGSLIPHINFVKACDGTMVGFSETSIIGLIIRFNGKIHILYGNFLFSSEDFGDDFVDYCGIGDGCYYFKYDLGNIGELKWQECKNPIMFRKENEFYSIGNPIANFLIKDGKLHCSMSRNQYEKYHVKRNVCLYQPICEFLPPIATHFVGEVKDGEFAVEINGVNFKPLFVMAKGSRIVNHHDAELLMDVGADVKRETFAYSEKELKQMRVIKATKPQIDMILTDEPEFAVLMGAKNIVISNDCSLRYAVEKKYEQEDFTGNFYWEDSGLKYKFDMIFITGQINNKQLEKNSIIVSRDKLELYEEICRGDELFYYTK